MSKCPIAAKWLLYMFFIFFQTLNYSGQSNGSNELNVSTPFYMTHEDGSGREAIQFGISTPGPFKPGVFSCIEDSE